MGFPAVSVAVEIGVTAPGVPVQAMPPPSPRLCTRISITAYLMETTIASAQKISERIP